MREWFIVWGVFLVFIGSNRAERKGKPVQDACSRPGLKALSPESDLMNSVPHKSLLARFPARLPSCRRDSCRKQKSRGRHSVSLALVTGMTTNGRAYFPALP